MSGASEAEEDHHRSPEADHVVVVEPAELVAEFRPGNGGDLVHHEAAALLQAVDFVWFDHQSQEGRLGGVGGEGAHRY